MFDVNDVVVPTVNNAESLDKPAPCYRILQIGMGRVIAENTKTEEITDLTAGNEEPIEYYYRKVDPQSFTK